MKSIRYEKLPMVIFDLETDDLMLKSVKCLGAGCHLAKLGDQGKRNE